MILSNIILQPSCILNGSFCVEEYCDTRGRDTYHRETSNLAKKKIFKNIDKGELLPSK